MGRLLTKLRGLTGLLVPGGVLVLAAWAVQREEVVLSAVSPYAEYFCVSALVAAVLLSWYHDQSRLICAAAAVILTVLAHRPPIAGTSGVSLAAAILLPLNFGLFAAWKERGAMTGDGLVKVALVAGQAFGLIWLAGENGFTWPNAPPRLTQATFAAVALTLLTLIVIRRSKVEEGLLWALAAMFLGLNQLGGALYLYSGTAGLILVFAVLEHGYDIAYRDELTGLPGRRAFNNVIEHLGGTYAIAMCDVDHFKKFNDAYGHDVGDQVLKMVAEQLSRVGGGGRAFRYGGEEFLVLFRGRSAKEAEPFVESLRRSIAGAGFVPHGAQQPVSMTISIGVAERSTRHSTPELVLDAADAALYRAKAAGRNSVRLDETTPGVLAAG